MPMVEEERRTPRRLDASMSLLSDIAADALDPDYRRAAEKRATRVAEAARTEDADDVAGTGETRRSRWTGSVALGLGLLAIGLLMSVAYARVQESEAVISVERESLIERIRTADADTERLQDQVGSLEADISALESAQLENSATGSELAEQSDQVQALVGTRRVAGPGVTVTLDDAPDDWPGRDPEDSDVLYIDIQQVVNALWAAGAEAIEVNGQRLTTTSAIRSANNLIQVNYRPLSAPYHVSAVGDDNELAARFERGPGGQWLQVAKSDVGIQYSVTIADDDLVLPAGSAPLINAVPEEAP